MSGLTEKGYRFHTRINEKEVILINPEGNFELWCEHKEAESLWEGYEFFAAVNSEDIFHLANTSVDTSWSNVVGNLYQSILGSHEEKIQVITRWLDDIRNTPYVWRLSFVKGTASMVEKFSEPYRK